MPHIPPLQPVDASEPVKGVYEEFARRMSFPGPPNFIKTQGHSDAVARGTWDLVRNVLVLGEIPRSIKEMLFVAISSDRQCRYCTAAHVACCRMLGVEPNLIESLVHDVESIHDAKVRDMLLFGLKASRDPQQLAAADFDVLHGHGLKPSEIVELIAMAGLAVYANIMADATAMDADEMFASLRPGRD